MYFNQDKCELRYNLKVIYTLHVYISISHTFINKPFDNEILNLFFQNFIN